MLFFIHTSFHHSAIPSFESQIFLFIHSFIHSKSATCALSLQNKTHKLSLYLYISQTQNVCQHCPHRRPRRHRAGSTSQRAGAPARRRWRPSRRRHGRCYRHRQCRQCLVLRGSGRVRRSSRPRGKFLACLSGVYPIEILGTCADIWYSRPALSEVSQAGSRSVSLMSSAAFSEVPPVRTVPLVPRRLAAQVLWTLW